jgi:hypothetical protein
MKPNELAKLSALGFDTEKGRRATVNRYRRLIMSVRAMDKVGKTRFGLTATKPSMYLNFDRKIEQVTLDELGVKEEDLFIKEIRTDSNLTQDQHQKEWQKVQDAILWALRDSESIRSIIIDTESEMWELARMAVFGKLTQVMPYQYTALNAAYKFLLDQCDKYNVNVVFLNKLKKQYKNDQWNGHYEPSGFSKLKDIVQVNAEMYIDEDDDGGDMFVYEIINNGLRAEMNHMTFINEMATFPMVASMLTGTAPDEWE